jgi:SET domain
MGLFSAVKPFLFLVAASHVEPQVQGNAHLSNHVAGIVEWINSMPDGLVSEKISIREDPKGNSAQSSSGTNIYLAAGTDIQLEETVMFIPTEALIAPENAGKSCKMLQRILKEYDNRADGAFYPYFRFLFGSEEDDINGGVRRTTPAAWSSAGQTLLKTLVGSDLLPHEFGRTCTRKCSKVCSETKNPKRQQLEQDAYLIMLSRMKLGLMIPRKSQPTGGRCPCTWVGFSIFPSTCLIACFALFSVFDFINHRNGKWQNVDIEIESSGVRVYAIRNIAAGDQLYMSHTECKQCGNYKYKYVAQHVLKERGFVEDYPRRWVVDSGDTKESLLVEIDVLESGERILQWPRNNRRPRIDELDWIQTQATRLRDLSSTIQQGLAELESVHERNVLADYYRGYLEALELSMIYSEPVVHISSTCKTNEALNSTMSQEAI